MKEINLKCLIFNFRSLCRICNYNYEVVFSKMEIEKIIALKPLVEANLVKLQDFLVDIEWVEQKEKIQEFIAEDSKLLSQLNIFLEKKL